MRKKTKAKIICIFLSLDVVFGLLYHNALNYLIKTATAEIGAYTSTAVYSAVSESTDKQVFSGIYDIRTDDNGRIVFLSTDAFYANALCYELAFGAYKKLSEYAAEGVDIPIGALTGVRLFSGVGRTVNLRLITVVGVKCSFKSVIESGGINQTRQRLYIVVEPQIKLIVGCMTETVSESLQVLCYDNLIVGDVPGVYFQTQTVAGGQYFPL